MTAFRCLVRGLCNVSPLRQSQHFKKSVLRSLLFKDFRQNVSPARNYATYNNNKTIAFIINKNMETSLCISHVGTDSFVLSNGSEIVGPSILFPHSLFSWNVGSIEDVTEESLILFKLLEPKVDLLILGYGRREDYSNEMRMNILKICKKLDLRLELLPTEQAAGLFNFLAHEGRYFAAALIPPREIDIMKVDKSTLYLEEGDEDEELAIEEENLPLISDDKPKTKLLKGG